jgi:(p)ppGpp synthase/HD superfamily hydrolase
MAESQKEIERGILEFLEKKQTATNTLLAKEFGIEELQVNKILNTLRENGLVMFQQELHLTRGDLIMAKITSRGSGALLLMKTGQQSKPKGSYNFERISRAIEFAGRAHKDESRKGTSVPYIVHPLDVLSILLKNGASEDLAIAGVLHDVLEDTSSTKEEVHKNFGDAVTVLVQGASEDEKLTKASNEEKKKTWKLRKTQKIESVRKGGYDLRLLICADKLANIRDLIEDIRNNGEEIWSKFNATKEQEAWYYREIAAALASAGSSISDTRAYRELTACIQQVFGPVSV